MKKIPDVFLDDVLDLFTDIKTGHMGSYIYGNMPKQQDLLQIHGKASLEMTIVITIYQALMPHFRTGKNMHHILHPIQPPYCGLWSWRRIRLWKSYLTFYQRTPEPHLLWRRYVVPFISEIFLHAANLFPMFPFTRFKLISFCPSCRRFHTNRHLELWLAAQIGNIPHALHNQNLNQQLTNTLSKLSRLVGKGWLLLSVDTNQNESSLHKGYKTPAVESFVLSLFTRIQSDLPTTGLIPTSSPTPLNGMKKSSFLPIWLKRQKTKPLG